MMRGEAMRLHNANMISAEKHKESHHSISREGGGGWSFCQFCYLFQHGSPGTDNFKFYYMLFKTSS